VLAVQLFKMPSTSLSVGNKDYTNATVVIIGAGISGKIRYLSPPSST